MKKILAVIIAILMLVSLCACGNTDNDNAENNNNTVDNSSSADDTASGKDNEDGEANTDVNSSPAGYYDDAIDHSARETYKIVFIHLAVNQLCADEGNALAEFEEYFNIDLTVVNSGGDTDKIITMIEEYCIDGVDGLILDLGYNIPRAVDLCQEYEIPFLTLNNPIYKSDEERVCIAPCVVIDGYDSGDTLVDWMCENYSTYWGEVDTSKIGYIGGTFSASVDIQARVEGGKDSFLEHFPDNTDKWFYADTVVGNLNVDTAYQEISAIITANKDIEYWIIVAAAGDIGTGAARAVEDLKLSDSILIGSVPGSTLMAEWQAGYSGCWVCCVDFTYLDMASQTLAGLVAMIDGRATLDNLWEEVRAEGDVRTKFISPCNVLTAETFTTFYSDLYASYGLEYKGAGAQ